MNPKEIKTHPFFKDLFPIKPELLNNIEKDMKDCQYDESQPIILGTWEGQDEPVCIDGHTRLQAAKNAGITEVPVYEYDYTSEEAAIEHAIGLQCHRRNLTDGELLRLMQVTDKRNVSQREANGQFAAAPSCAPGKSSEATAELLGISARKVEQMRTILDHGDAEMVEAVKNNETSVNKGYKETQKRRKEKKEKAETKKSKDKSVTKPKDMEKSEQQPEPRSVLLSADRFSALKELGGCSIEEHVARAVDRYLHMIGSEPQELDDGDYDD